MVSVFYRRKKRLLWLTKPKELHGISSLQPLKCFRIISGKMHRRSEVMGWTQ